MNPNTDKPKKMPVIKAKRESLPENESYFKPQPSQNIITPKNTGQPTAQTDNVPETVRKSAHKQFYSTPPKSDNSIRQKLEQELRALKDKYAREVERSNKLERQMRDLKSEGSMSRGVLISETQKFQEGKLLTEARQRLMNKETELKIEKQQNYKNTLEINQLKEQLSEDREKFLGKIEKLNQQKVELLNRLKEAEAERLRETDAKVKAIQELNVKETELNSRSEQHMKVIQKLQEDIKKLTDANSTWKSVHSQLKQNQNKDKERIKGLQGQLKKMEQKLLERNSEVQNLQYTIHDLSSNLDAEKQKVQNLQHTILKLSNDREVEKLNIKGRKITAEQLATLFDGIEPPSKASLEKQRRYEANNKFDLEIRLPNFYAEWVEST